jgi:hypothetical protein
MIRSVIVYDFDRERRAVSPAKTDAPLLVDADAVLARPIATQLLQPIPWRHTEFFEGKCRVEEQELTTHDAVKR